MAVNFNVTVASIEDIASHQPQYGILNTIQHNPILSSCLAVALALYVLGNALSPRNDLAEPPLVAHQIPFVGHLLGIFIYGINYFADVA